MKPGHRDGVGTVALETGVVTALALFLSLRFESPLVWLFLPLPLLLALRRSLSDYGLDLHFTPPSWSVHLVLGAGLLCGYAVLHAAVALAFLGRSFELRLLTNPAVELSRQFLGVAFPEEVFFRGYVQSRWQDALPARWTIFGAKVGPALFVQATIFALCHLATGDWTRLRVFFFALLAGWLRARSRSVLSPAVYHAVANVWYGILADCFR